MINSLMLEGEIINIVEIKNYLHHVTIKNQYYKFENNFKIIMFKHILNENLEYYYKIGDKVLITNLSVYQKDGEIRFRFNEDSQMKVLEKAKEENEEKFVTDKKDSKSVTITNNDFWK